MKLTNTNLEDIFDNYYVSQNFIEIEWLVNKVEKIIEGNTRQNRPSVILEIGVQSGGSMKIWEQLLKTNGKKVNVEENAKANTKDNILIGIDLGNTIAWDINNSDITTKMIIGNSHDIDTLRQVKKILFDKRLPEDKDIDNKIMRQIDFVYIDGEHSSEAAKKDFYMFGSLVRNGGGVGFHDVFDIKKFLDILNQSKLEIFKGLPPFRKYGTQASIGTAFYQI